MQNKTNTAYLQFKNLHFAKKYSLFPHKAQFFE